MPGVSGPADGVDHGVFDPDGGLAGAIIASSPLPIVVLDLEQRVRLVNPAAEELFGVSAAEVRGHELAERLPPETASDTIERIEAAARGEEGHLEIAVQHATRGMVAVGISFAPLLLDGRRHGSVGVGRDISDRKRLERELAELATGFRALSEASDLAVYRLALDPSPRFEHVNRVFERGSGWTLDELRADHDGFAATLPRELQQAIVARRRDPAGHGWPLEFEWTSPDGAARWLSLFEVAARDERGRVESITGIIRDATRRRRQQAALADALRMERAAAEELRRIDELRRLFLQATSHELRTPLTAVLGLSTILRDRGPELPPERSQELSGRICSQAGKLQRLLDDLLDVERLSRGVVELRREPTDVGALVAAAVREVQSAAAPGGGTGGAIVAAAERPARVTVELPPAPIIATLDGRKVERILVNLLANARKHAGEQSRVVVRVRSDARPVECAARRGGDVDGAEDGTGLPPPVIADQAPGVAPPDADEITTTAAPGVRIEVEDDGPGIPDDLKRRVFGLFERIGGDDVEHAPGTGIGLTLVAGLTQLHGGCVWIEDPPRGGTRVVLWLPDRDGG
jgi:PAS domain S-box-containing protein